MFFIEVLCDMALRENLPEFVVRIQREIFRIVDAVAPADGSGAANVKVARRVGCIMAQSFGIVSADQVPGITIASREESA